MQINLLRFFILFLLYAAPVNLVAQINVGDSLALVDLYDSTNGVNWWSNNNWKTLAPVSTWSGISVINNRVIGMQMHGNNASGTIPSSFKNLDGMTSIDFIDNGFRGDLLSYISNFKGIGTVHIGEQYLTGPFPTAFGYLPNLTSIYIYGPGFNGPIPVSFKNLTSLIALDVSYSAHSGDIPSEELSNLNFGKHSLVLTANRYTFRELEPLVEIFRAKNKEDVLEYTDQANIATIQRNDDLVVSAGGVLPHNTYQWYKEGTGLVATFIGDSTYSPTVPGIYSASVTNSVATQLTLNSIPVKAAAVRVPVCPLPTPFFVNSDVYGNTYQWQESVDSVTFNNIADNTNYIGTQEVSLQLQNLPSSWYGRKYRCIANGINSTVFTIDFSNTWISTGTTNWENSANWSCGKLPDMKTDVVINSGTVVLNSNVIIRSLHLGNGVTFIVSPGYKLIINH
ncbi:MAG: hypothetical protein ABIS01_04905 [Ferruginibacter sp.]